jgi:type I restriction-modification system DNA methylase subunit
MTDNINQVKSRDRVSRHGEVFTKQREVNAMLDLVKHETERIDSRFLEPACGNGNFLAEVLKRKLAVVESRYGKSKLEWERNSLIAISSIYGVDIQEDNALGGQFTWFFHDGTPFEIPGMLTPFCHSFLRLNQCGGRGSTLVSFPIWWVLL